MYNVSHEDTDEKRLDCKVQLHVPVVHPGQRAEVGDRQSGRRTVGKLYSLGPLR